jgi:hypothetical protein
MLPVTPGVDDGRRVLIVYESEDKPSIPDWASDGSGLRDVPAVPRDEM